MSCRRIEDTGAYVLGALPEDEHARFAAHLAGCEACRAEVEQLRMVADTLPLGAVSVPPPPELKDRIMAVVEAEADAAVPDA
jgi:anti-sigma factor RsiW